MFPTWLQVGGLTSCVGLVIWLLWHTLINTIPNMNKEQAAVVLNMNVTHAALVQSMNVLHTEIVNNLVAEFRAEAKEQRTLFQQRADVLTELARSGQIVIHEVSEAVSLLQHVIQGLGIKVQDNTHMMQANTTVVESNTEGRIEQVRQAHYDRLSDSKIVKGRDKGKQQHDAS